MLHFHMAVTADFFRNGGQRDRDRMICWRKISQNVLDQNFIVHDQFALDAAILRVAENIENRSPQPFQPGEKTEERHDPGPKTGFYRVALLVLAAKNRRCKMELEARLPFERRRDLLCERAVAVKSRDLIFVLDREQLEIIASR